MLTEVDTTYRNVHVKRPQRKRKKPIRKKEKRIKVVHKVSTVRTTRNTWKTMMMSYVLGYCQSYRDVAKTYHVNLKAVARRAMKERWFEQRMSGEMMPDIDRVMLVLRSEQADLLTSMVKESGELSSAMLKRIRTTFEKNDKGKMTPKSIGQMVDAVMVVSKLSAPILKIMETRARIAADADNQGANVNISAPNATTLSVHQYQVAIRGSETQAKAVLKVREQNKNIGKIE